MSNSNLAEQLFQPATPFLVLVERPVVAPCPSARVPFYLGDFSMLSEAGRNAVCYELMVSVADSLMTRNALRAETNQAFQALPKLERLKAENVAANIQGIWRQSGYNDAVIDAALVGLSAKPLNEQVLVFRVGVR